jgi:hypothetical protein
MIDMKSFVWSFLYGLSRVGFVMKWPLMTAISWRLALVPLADVPRGSASKKRVIVLNKIGGTDDIVAAYRNSESEIDFFLLRRNLISTVFNHFLNGRVRHYNYISDDNDIEASKEAYRDYLKRVIFYVNKMWPFSAIISFNIAYAAEHELATTMSELGIPFIVCHKECVKTESQHIAYSNAYQNRVGPYTGSYICVYNEEEKESMIRANLALPDQIVVVGAARLDFSHEMRLLPTISKVEKTILYYTVFEQAGLPYLDKKWVSYGGDKCSSKPFDWGEVARITSEALVEIANENPDIRVIFKAKQGNEKSTTALLNCEEQNNIDLIAGGVGHNLLQEANVVVAFNSVSLFESIAAGKKVVVPMFAVDQIPNIDKFIYHIGDVVTLASNQEEFKSALLSILQETSVSDALSEEAQQVLDRYVGNSDGMAGERMRKFIGEIINAPK